jgi:hypothetical protein
MNIFTIMAEIVRLKTCERGAKVICTHDCTDYLASDDCIALLYPHGGKADESLWEGIPRHRREPRVQDVRDWIASVTEWRPLDIVDILDLCPPAELHTVHCDGESCGCATTISTWYIDEHKFRSIAIDGVEFDASYIAALVRLSGVDSLEYGISAMSSGNFIGLRCGPLQAALMGLSDK